MGYKAAATVLVSASDPRRSFGRWGISMSPQDVFDVVAVVSVTTPCVIAMAAVFVPKPRSILLRTAVGVMAGWITAIVLTICVYNPAGIAAAIAAGVDSPEMRYDNNTVAVAILGGWLYPAMAVALSLGIRALLVRHRVASGRRV